MARRFRIVPISEYLAASPRNKGPQPAAITFDDGAKGTFDNISPVLRREGLPATLFVSTGHLCGGPLLWFSYLNALCFEDVYAEVTVEGQRFSLVTLKEKKRARGLWEPWQRIPIAGGDYDGAVFSRVRDSGYEAAVATRPRNVGSERFEIGRVGIYSPSMMTKLKAGGFVELAQSVGMRVG